MGTTNYFDTFIAIAPDSDAARGTLPKESAAPSVAFRTYRMIHENPYRFTSDEVIFAVYADRNSVPPSSRDEARRAFFTKGQACLRASDLGKRYGWGIHSDAKGRVALFGVETPEYQAFLRGGASVTVTYAMRSRAKT